MKHLRYFDSVSRPSLPFSKPLFSDTIRIGQHIKYIKHDTKEFVCEIVGRQNNRFRLKMLYVRSSYYQVSERDKKWRIVKNQPTIFFRENEITPLNKTGKIVTKEYLEEIEASIESEKFNI